MHITEISRSSRLISRVAKEATSTVQSARDMEIESVGKQAGIEGQLSRLPYLASRALRYLSDLRPPAYPATLPLEHCFSPLFALTPLHPDVFVSVIFFSLSH